MLKVTSMGDLPKKKIEYIFNELQLKYNIHKIKNNENEGQQQYYNFSQEIYYENKEIVPYLIKQINILSQIIFELFKTNINDEVNKDLILNGFIEQYKHNGLTGEQFKELSNMINTKELVKINDDPLTKDFTNCIDEDLQKLNEAEKKNLQI